MNVHLYVEIYLILMVWEEIIDFSTNFENTQQLQSWSSQVRGTNENISIFRWWMDGWMDEEVK